jgi:Protein of unknown function with HXXEE motif
MVGKLVMGDIGERARVDPAPAAVRAKGWPAILWLFPFVTLLHNLEEAIWLPAWSQHGSHLHPPVEPLPFRFSVMTLSLLAFVITYLASRGGQRSLEVYAAYSAAMLGNVVLPHVLQSVMEWAYTPGIATALALNLPVNGYLLWRIVIRDKRVAPKRLAVTMLFFVPPLVVSIPLLTWLGSFLARFVG